MKPARAARLLGLAAAALALGLTVAAPGPTLNDLQRALANQKAVQQAQAARANSLRASVGRLQGREAQLNAQVTTLSAQLSGLEKQLAATQAKLSDLNAKARETERQIAAQTAKVERERAEAQQLILSLYRERSGRYLRLIANADNVYDLLIKARYLDRLGTQNLNIISQLNTDILNLENQKLQYQALIGELNRQQALLETRKDAVSAARANLNVKLAALRETRAGQQAVLYQTISAQQQTSASISSLVSQVAAEQARLAEEARLRAEAERRRRAEEAARIARIRDQQQKAEAARLEEQRRQAAAQAAAQQPAPLPASVGSLAFPVSGGSITAPFGGSQDYITIRAPGNGWEVRAAADGVVSEAGLVQANSGYMVLIAHTPTLFTAYRNLQAPNVVAGQTVRRGDLIGYVGGGTLEPPDVLYFQVVRADNGQAVYDDPGRYFAP
ncbi:MAG TPA: peptidoglycan DD-metalloendopeptidase family protein [Deinococcales bacterium]|nr:peptidoglycan DD-metalloendopeptidase family protein [Deinococcales bacterium]